MQETKVGLFLPESAAYVPAAQDVQVEAAAPEYLPYKNERNNDVSNNIECLT